MLAATPIPVAFEIGTYVTLDAMMWALSRAWSVQNMPAPGLAGLAEAMIDCECRMFCGNAARVGQVVLPGAALVPVASDLYPGAGATVVAPVRLGSGQRLRLTGPGIETSLDFAMGGAGASVRRLRDARCRDPAGFDLFGSEDGWRCDDRGVDHPGDVADLIDHKTEIFERKVSEDVAV